MNQNDSFEYFPPKTSQGVQNLYDRMQRMAHHGPQFIDVTWNQGWHGHALCTNVFRRPIIEFKL